MIIGTADVWEGGTDNPPLKGLGRKILHTCASLFLGLDGDKHRAAMSFKNLRRKIEKRGKGEPSPRFFLF